MKTKIKFIILLLMLIPQAWVSAAQPSGQRVKGTVIDENRQPIEFVGIVILSLPDSTIVGGGMTDKNGIFDMESPESASIVQISMVGYNMVELPISEFADAVTVIMTPNTMMLEGAVVSVHMPSIEVKGDAVVTNIAGSVLEHSGNALDVLAKVPGIINNGGSLEVIGRGAPVYYINGRKVADNSELRNLMSEDIRSVDVVSNPGALYGGEVNAVVRIRTVKRQGEGISFAMTSQAKQHIYTCNDFEPTYSVLDLNYRVKGLDFFGKAVYWENRNYQLSSFDDNIVIAKDNGNHDFSQRSAIDARGHNGGWEFVGGSNWQINDRHSIGFKLDRNFNTKGNTKMLMDSDIFLDNIQVDHAATVNDTQIPTSTQWIGNLYYDGTLGKLGINFNADFVDGRTESFTQMHESSWTSPAELSSHSDSWTSMGAGKLVLTHPIGKGSLQFGAEETYVTAGQAYEITFAGISSTNAHLTENTVAGFAEYSTMLPFGQLSAGIRYEHANFGYHDHIDDTKSLERVHDNWFPSLSFATMLGKVGLSVSYSGKTQRPSYGMLSNEVSYNNRYSYQTGDPKLLNEKRQTAALNANWKWLSISGNYQRVDNSFVQWANPYNDEGIMLIRFSNLDVPLRKLNVYLIASPTIGVWSPMYTVGVQKQFLTLTVEDPRAEGGYRDVTLNKPMYLLQLNNAFRFKHSWVLNADYYYYSKMNTSNIEIYRPIQAASLSVQKSFLKDDALTLNLTCSDIFNSSMQYAKVDYGRYVVNQVNDTFNSYITLRVSYRFNSTNSKYKGTGAGEGAKSRMK
ncbi:MAG: TonB-dependent receptor family protein [Bacteroidales bacterium]|nr:TonB-dependent receptor family protein [Bacteroidales bacterium]